MSSRNRSSQEDGFRLLVSSNYFFLRFSKLTWQRHQITVIDVLGPGQFRLAKSRDLANLGKSFSRIWPFSISHLLGLGRSRQVIFWICWVGKNVVADFILTYNGLKIFVYTDLRGNHLTYLVWVSMLRRWKDLCHMNLSFWCSLSRIHWVGFLLLIEYELFLSLTTLSMTFCLSSFWRPVSGSQILNIIGLEKNNVT